MSKNQSFMLLSAIEEIENLRKQLKEEKKKSLEKKPMEKLNYRFPSTTKTAIKSLSDCMEMSESDIARVALFLGTKELSNMLKLNDGLRIAKGNVHINKIRIMLDKNCNYNFNK